VDGAVAVTCAPASGAVFHLGTTTVSCSAADAAGNRGTAVFTVTVADVAPPVVTVPGPLTVPATSAAGAVVSFAAGAIDNVDGAVAVTCAPASGSVFRPGTTTVSCSAADAARNAASAAFTVTVSDAAAPALTLPGPLNVPATSPSGAIVAFAVSAVDAVDGPVAVLCSAASGSVFRAGDTTVRCSAADRSGNTASGDFLVHVRGAGEQLDELLAAVKSVGSAKGLIEEVREARSAYLQGHKACACGELQDFIDEVRAQRGRRLPAEAAADFIVRATRIRAVLDCQRAGRRDDNRRHHDCDRDHDGDRDHDDRDCGRDDDRKRSGGRDDRDRH